jgi:hypothetical protein
MWSLCSLRRLKFDTAAVPLAGSSKASRSIISRPRRQHAGVAALLGIDPAFVFRTAIFESSEFCSACHQFPADLAVNGKPQCHAPLAEQLTDFETKRAQGMAHISEGLAAAGNACGGCHLRRYQHFGPPQRGTGATGASQRTRSALTNDFTQHSNADLCLMLG